MSAPIRIVFSFAVLACLAGCNDGASVGGNDPDPHAPDGYGVSGGITYENEPVTGEATFTPIDGGGAIKVPVENGSYSMRAAPGKYRVTIAGKAGDADLPEGLSVERAVGKDTANQTISITLPETDPELHEGSTPDEVREMSPSGTSGE